MSHAEVYVRFTFVREALSHLAVNVDLFSLDRLCVSVLAVDRFGDGVEACYGVFDGDRNEEVPRLLQCTMGDVLCEELQHSSIDNVYMSNTFLTSHR